MQMISEQIIDLSLSKEQRYENNRRSSEVQKQEPYKAWHRKWQKEKENNDVAYKLKRRVGALLRYHMKKNGMSTFNVLGYPAGDLKAHLESMFELWMSWNNWGVYDAKSWDDGNQGTWTWQIDHIIPISSFNIQAIGDDEFRKCWALSNLRPLSAKANILKGASIQEYHIILHKA